MTKNRPKMHRLPTPCDTNESLFARIETLERKLKDQDRQIFQLRLLFLKLRRKQRDRQLPHPLADQLDQLRRQIQPRTRVSPNVPPLHPIWN